MLYPESFILTTTLSLLLFSSGIDGRKKYRLAMLCSVVMDGGASKLSEAVIRLITDNVNNRSDYLPDYHIEPVFRDEGANSYKAVANLFSFKRSFQGETNITEQTLYPSPVVIAGRFSGGCLAYGPVMPYVDVVGIPFGCIAPDFTANRRKFPNMYRTRIPGDSVIYPRVAFVNRIGKWQRISIIVDATNTANILTAKKMYELSLASNITISRYDPIMKFEDNSVIKALKDDDARVIFLETTDLNGSCIFLCQTYQFRMTGSRYVFILAGNVYMDPNVMPERFSGACTRKMVVEQLKYTIFIGPIPFSQDPGRRSTLGETHRQYDTNLANYLGNSIPGDYSWRDTYYDVILQALFTLDGAERILKRRNMTLSDYMEHPKEVMMAANESAGKVDYFGMRTGRIHFSQRLEVDDESQFIFQWNSNDGLRSLFDVRVIPNAKPTLVDSYDLRTINAINWATDNRKPPPDGSRYLKVIDGIPNSGFIVVSFFAVILIACQTAYIAQMISRWNPDSNHQQLQAECLFLIGCILLDGTAVCILLNEKTFLCILRVLLGVLGLSFIHGVLFWQLLTYSRKRRSQRIRASRSHPKCSLACLELLVFMALSVVVVVTWLVTDPVKAVEIQFNEKPTYDDSSDVVIDLYVNICKSSGYGEMWLLLLAAIQSLPLFGGLYLAYILRTSNDSAQRLGKLNLLLQRMAIVNAATLFFLAFIILLIIDVPTSQELAVGVIVLVDSLTSSGIVMWPSIKAVVGRVMAKFLANFNPSSL